MLSLEILDFCERWTVKAEHAISQQGLAGAFDGFFSYFVVFNRLYGAATLDLAHKGKVKLPEGRFPDSKAAKCYAADYIGPSVLIDSINDDPKSAAALEQIRTLLEDSRFYVKLDFQGRPQQSKDEDLSRSLNSPNAQIKSRAILDLLYSLRCNMFHGQKGFNEVQREILDPSTTLLRKVTESLLSKLKESHG